MTDHRRWSWMLVSCAFVGTLLTGWAVAQQPAGSAPKAQRPPAAVMQVEAVDPKLDALLKEWERNTAGIKMLHGEHFRREYNDVFQVEKQSEGMFYFEAPDKGRIDMKGTPPAKGAVSRKKDPTTGKAYRLEAGMDQIWICNGKQIVVVDQPQKQFERMDIPPEMQGNNIIRSPLPFLFGMKADDAKRRFQMNLAKDEPGYWVIDVVPRSKADAQNYSQARVYLDKEKYVPFAVRLIDPSGSGSTEYLFDREKLKINNPGLKQFLFKTDPFNPNLSSYKEIQAPNAGVQPASNQVPASSKSASTRPGSTAPQKAPTTQRPPTAPPPQRR
ncbi:MAG: hypothetical protein SH850_02620 [Planctomycetaceae bacterium]|nr:hypothetical protein [Planctomycetaceae bacterium]